MLPGIITGTKGLSLVKILSGLSASIKIAREFIPVYNQIKPVIKAIPKVLNKIPRYENHSTNITQNKKSEPNQQNSISFFQ